MNNTNRMQIGVVSSLVLHLVMVLLISLGGVFPVPTLNNQIVEIAIVGGGGGGNGGSDDIDFETANAGAVLADNTPIVPKENIATDNTFTINKQVEEVAKDNKNYSMQKTGEQNLTNNINNTVNNGNSSELGQGTGVGSGSGAGSGSGTGSGHGAGSGAGSGEGHSVGSAQEAAVPPRLVQQRSPEYPSAARQKGIVGTVLVKIVVAKDGSVEQATVAETSGTSSLDSAAVKAVKAWKFTAAQDKFGRAVRCYNYIPITFSLK